jgi:Na+-transporting NADH:ubiquinone oxidoreductase subunit NqrF
VVYVITRPGESWQGHTGFITAGIVRAELDEPRAWTYYVVGPPPMITAMQKVIDELGIPETQVVTETFAGYAS